MSNRWTRQERPHPGVAIDRELTEHEGYLVLTVTKSSHPHEMGEHDVEEAEIDGGLLRWPSNGRLIPDHTCRQMGFDLWPNYDGPKQAAAIRRANSEAMKAYLEATRDYDHPADVIAETLAAFR